ncbi:hypothetical protein M422DRAFT_34090, partial [Sphaerobolus stellatus SS14]
MDKRLRPWSASIQYQRLIDSRRLRAKEVQQGRTYCDIVVAQPLLFQKLTGSGCSAAAQASGL